jgi:hypothetical protein
MFYHSFAVQYSSNAISPIVYGTLNIAASVLISSPDLASFTLLNANFISISHRYSQERSQTKNQNEIASLPSLLLPSPFRRCDEKIGRGSSRLGLCLVVPHTGYALGYICFKFDVSCASIWLHEGRISCSGALEMG